MSSVKTTCTSHLQNHMLFKSNWRENLGGEVKGERGGHN